MQRTPHPTINEDGGLWVEVCGRLQHVCNTLAPCFCWHSVIHATILLTMSATTTPRTPSSRSLSAVFHQGRFPQLNRTRTGRAIVNPLFLEDRRSLFDVMPNGPGAAPRMAVRRHVRNLNSSNSNCTVRWVRTTSWPNSCLGRRSPLRVRESC